MAKSRAMKENEKLKKSGKMYSLTNSLTPFLRMLKVKIKEKPRKKQGIMLEW